VSRLYNFNGPNTMDPSLDPTYAQILKEKCSQGSPSNSNTTVFMDPETPVTLHNVYYDEVIANRGLFTSDATLLTDPNAKSSVTGNSGPNLVEWHKKFAAAIVKMGNINVLTGNQGGVRVNCRVANS
jgi:peroxidase